MKSFLIMAKSPVTPISAISILILLSTASFIRASFNDEERNLMLEVHNRLRQTAFPSAIAMRQVIWSQRLESLAARAAQRCEFQHSTGPDYDPLGENIYMGPSADPKRIVLAWYSEKSAFNPELTSCGGKCGHYTQVMTAMATEIGCQAQFNCVNSGRIFNITFCLYNVGNGNFVSGPLCSECPAIMPVCRNGLCVSETTVLDSMRNGTSGLEFECLLICRNCGKLITNPLNPSVCRCDCSGTDATGSLCEVKPTTSTVKCSPCSAGVMSQPCQNGGTADESITDPLKCKCKCTAEFVGNRCEIPLVVFSNSVKLVLLAAREFKFASFVIMPPVDKFLFKSRIWPMLKTEMTKAVNSFCRINSNFDKCCPGKTFPSNAATADHVKDDDFNFIITALGHTFNGALIPLVFATFSSSTLCPGGASPTSPALVPQAALIEALKSAQAGISAQLASCCQKMAFEDITLNEISAPVLADLQVGVLLPQAAPRKSSCVSMPSKMLRAIMLLLLAIRMA